MNSLSKLFVSEMVGSGHPDKICDQIADAILDEYIKADPTCKVACEVLACHKTIVIAGEFSSSSICLKKNNIQTIVHQVLKDNHYTQPEINEISIQNISQKQSQEITNIVAETTTHQMLAGDQGFMVGYANDETTQYHRADVFLAKYLCYQLEKFIKTCSIIPKYDFKVQVITVANAKTEAFCAIKEIVVSINHVKNMLTSMKNTVNPIINKIILDAKKYFRSDLQSYFTPKNINAINIKINPGGNFVKSGFYGDSGLTGRKIICDSYGSSSLIGGGSFSGKDASKVDRSGAYFCRYIARNLVANKICSRVQIIISYAFGMLEPRSISINTFNTLSPSCPFASNFALQEYVTKVFSFHPKEIIDNLQLNKPIYYLAAKGYHFFSLTHQFPWEKFKSII